MRSSTTATAPWRALRKESCEEHAQRADWTERYQPIATVLATLPIHSAILDGEVCVQLPSGSTNSSALQDALATGDSERLVYFVFDLLYLDGYDLRRTPLKDRKRALEGLLAAVATTDGAVHFHDRRLYGNETGQRLGFALAGRTGWRLSSLCRQGRNGIYFGDRQEPGGNAGARRAHEPGVLP